jgi:hypothetical protein
MRQTERLPRLSGVQVSVSGFGFGFGFRIKFRVHIRFRFTIRVQVEVLGSAATERFAFEALCAGEDTPAPALPEWGLDFNYY